MMRAEIVKVKYNGHSYEFNTADLDMANPESPSNQEVLTALGSALSHETGNNVDLSGFEVEPPENARMGDSHNDDRVLIAHPAATYG